MKRFPVDKPRFIITKALFYLNHDFSKLHEGILFLHFSPEKPSEKDELYKLYLSRVMNEIGTVCDVSDKSLMIHHQTVQGL